MIGLLLTFFIHADVWKVSTSYKFLDLDKENSTQVSELLFSSKEGRTVTYLPTVPPFGFVDYKETLVYGKRYFITRWADGAHTTHFKVFDPDFSKNPICSFTSHIETTKLRYIQNKIQFWTANSIKNDKLVMMWAPCTL